MQRRCLSAALACTLAAAAFLSPGTASAQANVTGQWAKLQNLRMSPIHTILMPNGKLMMWGKPATNQEYSWDPVTQAFADLAGVPYDIFCAGHAYLGDGRLLVAGGHIADYVGLAKASVYNPVTNTWSTAPDMTGGRWYTTVTTLPNGDALVVAGQMDTKVGMNPLPQVYQTATNSWRSLTGAQLSQPMYPMMFVAPNGKVIDVGPTNVTRWLDTAGTGTWSSVGNRRFGWRDYGSAVMYDGKVLVMGGGDPPVNTAEVIDLNVATPSWRAVAPMSHARRQLNATVLPDGTVLATGGTSGPGHDNPATPVFAAELWNPATETWTTLSSMTVPRMYHSVALLLPDGRVASMGGDGYFDVEVFSPPYLFKGARPTMSGVPSNISYGQAFTVQSPEAASIQKVTLIPLGSVTHAFNQNQRLNTLQFTAGSGTVTITPPANGSLAPPGRYMVFLVNGSGVPSMAGMVMLGGSGSTQPPPPNPAPALSSLSPSSATAGGPAFTLTVNGSNFISGAKVRWNGADRATTFTSGTQLTAAIPAGDISAQGTAQVSVLNPSSTASGTLAFAIAAATTPPPPTGGSGPALNSLSPTSAAAGGPAFTLTVNGSNFTSGAVVRWNGSARATTFMRKNRLRATITAADIAAAGTAQVTVLYTSGVVSGALPFTVTGGSTGGTTNFTLSVSKSGTAPGNGLITSNPGGISCGAACTASFAGAGSVTLSAAISSGGVFAGWGGACAGTAPTCTLTMDENKSVTATINTSGGSTACVPYPEWDPNLRYVGGEKVTRLGKYYIAKVVGDSVWNVNSPPEWSPNYWDPTTCP
jgi:hypothetical protein